MILEVSVEQFLYSDAHRLLLVVKENARMSELSLKIEFEHRFYKERKPIPANLLVRFDKALQHLVRKRVLIQDNEGRYIVNYENISKLG
jgi:hypothetical protein